jgi:RimJ/RimL family protein N-acetyltransferase
VAFDADRGWTTARLRVEPLTAADADELHPLLDDPALHLFIGGAPLAPQALAARYRRLAVRRSPDGTQVWANWVLRERAGGVAVGTLQATVPAGGPGDGAAEVAWVVGTRWQRRGLATEAARGLVARLLAEGFVVVAHVHPDHLGSARVAASAGLSPTDDPVTDELHDGEVRWVAHPGMMGR